ncbi:MAG: phosphatidate cytidylyltransferase [Chitinophagales bacterium]|nr:MAG: phosphatidate cytidylyltransferase [Chitinophagales bacterium]
MRNFLIRTQTALIFVGVMVGGIWWNVYSYGILMSLIILFCLYEYFKIIRYTYEANRVSRFYMPLGILTGLSAFVCSWLVLMHMAASTIYVVPVCLLFSFFALEIFSASSHPLANIAQNISGVIYVSIPFTILNYVAVQQKDYNPHMVLGILFLVWINDAAAYIFGSLWGKHKMLERISPNKTLEGFLGGAIGCLVVAWLQYLIFGIFSLTQWLGLSLVIWVFATLGDLIVSMFKRSVSIKDTGNFFPGHGGFLDRFDAFIFAVPYAAAYIILIRLYGF